MDIRKVAADSKLRIYCDDVLRAYNDNKITFKAHVNVIELNFPMLYGKQYGEPFVSKWRYKIPCVCVPKNRLDMFLSNRLGRKSTFIESIGRDRLDIMSLSNRFLTLF